MGLTLMKARWRCRRGMRELDLLLETFLHEEFEDLSDADKRRFEELLEQPDPVILAWLGDESLAALSPHAELLGRIARCQPPPSSST